MEIMTEVTVRGGPSRLHRLHTPAIKTIGEGFQTPSVSFGDSECHPSQCHTLAYLYLSYSIPFYFILFTSSPVSVDPLPLRVPSLSPSAGQRAPYRFTHRSERREEKQLPLKFSK